MAERDFVGYGRTPPAVEWPDQARLAVQLVVNYEEGAEYSLLDGDSHRESTGEVASPIPLTERDLINESFFEYGSRVGVWRLLDLLDKHRVKATFLTCGQALERNPAVGCEITERGHEAAGHGYRWDEPHKMTLDEERRSIDRAVQTIERLTGQRPVGWMPRYGPSLNTRRLVAEQGGFIYDSCPAINDDLPYFVTVANKPWLVIPYSSDLNDNRMFRGGGGGPDDFYALMRYSFEMLYEEGATNPKMMTVALHCRTAGRPSLARVVDNFLTYARTFPKVWFARRMDIARWWLSHHQAFAVKARSLAR